jgi:glycosyltransferase involved in cell wall biosynthesis
MKMTSYKRDSANCLPKLCVITQRLPNREGSDVLVTDLLRVLEPIASEIFVISGNFPEKSISGKIHVLNIKNSNKRRSMFVRTLNYLIEQIKVSMKIAKLPRDVDIVIFYIGANFYIFGNLIAKLLKKKTVIIVTGSAACAKNIYGNNVFPVIMIALEKFAYNLTDHIIVESKSIISQLGLKRYKKKIILGGSFFDTNLFRLEKSISQREELVGYIGRLGEEKGIINFVTAIPLILKKRTDLKFLIGGDGQLREQIEKFLSFNNLLDKVEFKGWIPRDQLVNYYNEFKLLVVPSYFESIPIVALEAMACGTPVLATPVGGITDVIKDEENGFILQNNLKETIADAVVNILKSSILDDISKSAHSYIQNDFTFASATERYRAILNDIRP